MGRLSALRQTPNLEDQVPVFMFPSDRVAQALGPLFVAFYDLHGCDVGILTRLHTEMIDSFLG
jgi:hypothetical protein